MIVNTRRLLQTFVAVFLLFDLAAVEKILGVDGVRVDGVRVD